MSSDTADHPAGSYYAATMGEAPAFPVLDDDARADVAILGGGYTGLSAALHLAEKGLDVVLLEQNRVGWGASGRNGGQIHTGQRRDVDWLEARFGYDRARRLWEMAESAVYLVRDLIGRHGIDCDLREGLFHVMHKGRYVEDARRHVEVMRDHYNYERLEWWERERLAEALSTPVYFGGWRDACGGHLHPLRFAQGLARAAAKAGARLCENTKVTAIPPDGAPRLVTERGTVTADTILVAGNGYLAGLDPDLEARVMPINNFVLATEQIGAGRPGGLIPGGEAISDSRFVVHYWRPTADGRLLFGGGETYTHRPPSDVASFVKKHMLKIYPQLKDVKVTHAWGGTLAVTVNRLPYLRRLRTGVYASCGYSGQGVTIAPYAGKIIAEAIADRPAEFDEMARFPCPPFPGGKWLRAPSLAAAMSWFALRDRL
ncbi:NAD(P)/FAD-dependent oxidoreductase [Lutibaculum baratangense]|nr:FAD-binding oxidoreductase [Lutibaculum baratangense]